MKYIIVCINAILALIIAQQAEAKPMQGHGGSYFGQMKEQCAGLPDAMDDCDPYRCEIRPSEEDIAQAPEQVKPMLRSTSYVFEVKGEVDGKCEYIQQQNGGMASGMGFLCRLDDDRREQLADCMEAGMNGEEESEACANMDLKDDPDCTMTGAMADMMQQMNTMMQGMQQQMQQIQMQQGEQ